MTRRDRRATTARTDSVIRPAGCCPSIMVDLRHRRWNGFGRRQLSAVDSQECRTSTCWINVVTAEITATHHLTRLRTVQSVCPSIARQRYFNQSTSLIVYFGISGCSHLTLSTAYYTYYWNMPFH